ncbi:MAG TPA: hypothetical protein VJW23_19640, partial [Propionibacteriaceae bacterium]|nr:hypothetical protein [Propionibacteriaceae bacterium]
MKYHDAVRSNQGEIRGKRHDSRSILSLHFSGNLGLLAQQTPENRGNPRGPRPAEGDFTPNMGYAPVGSRLHS